MRVIPTSVPDVLVIEPEVHRDDRGFLYEIFNEREFGSSIAPEAIAQANFSRSAKHVLRGLHYQLRRPQGKLVRVTRGEIYDVAVDLRRSSPTFRRWHGIRLGEEPPRMLWVPPGFAHGFLTLSDTADVEYQLTQPRVPADERCIAWNDPELAIAWPLTADPIVSARDRLGSLLAAAELYP